MAGEDGPVRPDITTKPLLPADMCNCDFYVLMEALYHRHGVPDQGISLRTKPVWRIVRFSSDVSISLPGTNLNALSHSQSGQYVLQTRLLGSFGSQSPLPGYYLDQMAQESVQNEDGLKGFLDLFSHCWTQFVYHAWHRYYYYICFHSGGTDAFPQCIYALAGLDNQSACDGLTIDHSKMPAYAGIPATPDRASKVIRNPVSHYSDLSDITIERWQLRKITINPAHQNRLGVHNPRGKTTGHIPGHSTLGVNFTLGAQVSDRSEKFLLQAGDLSRECYLSFLPDGENHLPLIMFLSLILRDQFVWDLRLCLASQQAKGMCLSDPASSRLGRISFIGQPKIPPAITVRIRE